MDINQLKALSSLDGRYFEKIASLKEYLSESALIKYRLTAEVKYLINLSKVKVIRKLSRKETTILLSLISNISDSDLLQIKTLEDKVKHDVKSVELFLRDKLKDTSLNDIIEKLHYCLTSEDINNISYRLMLKAALEEFLPTLKELITKIVKFSVEHKKLVMMARTHGQDAVPTTLGKEYVIYAIRLFKVYEKLSNIKLKLTGKLNGAIGGWNAHVFAEPKIDWVKFSQEFINSLGLEFNQFSTQINQFDDVVDLLSQFHLLNGIMLDFDQDCWRYISDGWLIQKVDLKAVGSSTMAQKVNPINFENSEGNAQIANGLIEVLMRTLPISRLQRDLSNSTEIRNLGSIFGHELLVIKSATTGLASITPDKTAINEYLNSNWAVLAEPLQILLRKHNIDNAFEVVKAKLMGKKTTQKEWVKIINSLKIDNKIKTEALKLDIQNYTGYCSKLVDEVNSQIKF